MSAERLGPEACCNRGGVGTDLLTMSKGPNTSALIDQDTAVLVDRAKDDADRSLGALDSVVEHSLNSLLEVRHDWDR
jgi:hypothetical protein